MSRVSQFIDGSPWVILPDVLETISDIGAREHMVTPEAIESMRGERMDEAPRVRIRDGVAVIAVRGPLFRYANLFTSFSGATSMELLATDIGAALRNDAVHALLFDIDSPGGMVNGVSELAELIYRARQEKTVIAFVSGSGASGAYWIASAAERVLAGPTAIVGSVGAVLQMQSRAKADEKAGIRSLEIVSSQSPRKRMDPFDENDERRADARSALQTLLDDLAGRFVADVARNRNITDEEVLDRYGQGGVFVGQAALNAGMVDGITTLEDLIAELSATDRRTGPGGRFAASAATADLPQALATSEDEMRDDPKPAADKQPVIDRTYLEANHADIVSELKAEGATAERERILAIQSTAGPDDVVAECVQDPTVTAGDAALKILAAQRETEKARADAHLKVRAEAEEGLEAPAPSTKPNTEATEDRVEASRLVTLHNRLKGRDSVAAA